MRYQNYLILIPGSLKFENAQSYFLSLNKLVIAFKNLLTKMSKIESVNQHFFEILVLFLFSENTKYREISDK